MHWLSEGAEVLIAELESGSPPRFDVVVVGSGYGGSVAAARFAQGGLRVCVLERGREYLPGEFPGDVGVLPRHVRISRPKKRKIVGDADALFDLRAGDDVAVLVGNALGGTSQINANVVEEPSTDIFKNDKWPAAFRDKPDEVLKDAFQRARDMLQATPVPAGTTYRKLQELEKFHGVLKDAKISAEFRRACLAVHFKDETNPQGVAQKACKHCGDCITGCNHWAKNTLTMNYLPEARRHGARLFTRATAIRVRQPAQSGGPWTVEFRLTSNLKDGALNTLHSILVPMVVIAAGTMGSSELLMRSSADGHLTLSKDRLGKRFSMNGDTIGFGYDQDANVNAFGVGSDPCRVGDPVGPTITGMVDLRCSGSKSQRVVIEDGAIPGALKHVAEELLTMAAFPHQLVSPHLRADVRKRKIDPLAVDVEAMARTQVYLAMGMDESSGELRLPPKRNVAGKVFDASTDARDNAAEVKDRSADQPEEGLLQAYWPEDCEACVDQAHTIISHSEALGAIALSNPLRKPLPKKFTEILSGPPIEGPLFSVHPLGGCAMADSAEAGVVNDVGQVFSGAVDSTVHDRLLVLDGSVLPTAVGINPLLTITALAERALRDHRVWNALGLPVPDSRRPPQRDTPPPPWIAPPYYPPGDNRVAIEFEETIRGPMHGQAYRFAKNQFWWDPAPIHVADQDCQSDAHWRRDHENRIGLAEYQSLSAPESDFEIEAVVKWKHDDLRELIASPEKKVGLTGTIRFFARKPVDNEQLRRLNGFDRRLLPESKGGPYKKPFFEEKISGGSLELMVRDKPFTGGTSGFIRWFRSRGLDEIRNVGIGGCLAHDEGWQDWLRRLPDMVYLWRHASRRRLMKYHMEFVGPDKKTYALKGTKCIHYAGANPAQVPLDFAERRFDEVCIHGAEAHRAWPFLDPKRRTKRDPDLAEYDDNLWVSLAAMPVVLVTRSSHATSSSGGLYDKTPIASGLLRIDLVDLASCNPPQITRQPDAIHGWLSLGSALLYLARVTLQGHLFSFRAPDYPEDRTLRPRTVPKEVCREPDESVDGPPRVMHPIHPEDVPGCERTTFLLNNPGEPPIRLTRYRHRSRGSRPLPPVLVFHGFAHSSAIFATSGLAPSTQDPCCENLVHHLCDHQFDVWLVDYRTSVILDSCRELWDYDTISLKDPIRVFECVAREIALERAGLTSYGAANAAPDVYSTSCTFSTIPPNPSSGPVEIHVIGHCMGAAIIHMALLSGRLRSNDRWKIGRAVFSQVGPFIYGSDSNRLRAEFVALLRDLLDIDHIDLSAHKPKDDDWLVGIADRIASTYPISKRERSFHDPMESERYSSKANGIRGMVRDEAPTDFACRIRYDVATCMRTALALGENWNHRNLSPQMHAILGHLLSRANMRTFEQIQDFVQKERLVFKEGINTYFTEQQIKDAYKFPVKFIHGKSNAVFDPLTSQDSCVRLQRAIGPEFPVLYSRIEGYGHLDCWLGRNAYRDVFPEVSQFLLGHEDKGRIDRGPEPSFTLFRPCKLGPIVGWVRKVCNEGWIRVWWKPDDSRSDLAKTGAVLIYRLNNGQRVDKQYLYRDFHEVRLPMGGSADGGLGEVTLSRFCVADLPEKLFVPGNHLVFGSISTLTGSARDPWGGRLGESDDLLKMKPLTWSNLPGHAGLAPFIRFGRELPIDIADPDDLESAATMSNFDAICRSLAGKNEIHLLVASCRYAGTSFERRLSSESLASMVKQLDCPDSAPDLLALLGDTIYADATAGVADTLSPRQRVVKRWENALDIGQLRELLKRVPTVMGIDDHEIWEDFEPTHFDGRRSEKKDLLADANWARNAFRVYAASHSPFGPTTAVPLLNEQAYLDTGAGFSYEMTYRNFPFFVLDTRTNRQPRLAGIDSRCHKIVSDAQWCQFSNWLLREQLAGGDRPKFVLSGSVIAPFHRESSRYRDSTGRDMYHYTRRDDGWQGYQKSLEDLVDLIVEEGIQNVVFLCGDYHASMTATLEFGSRDPAENDKAKSLRAYCVVASGLYSPLPFANTRLDELVHDTRGDTAYDGGRRYTVRTCAGRTLDYKMDNATEKSGFTILDVEKTGQRWRLTVDVRDTNGARATITTYPL